MEFIIWGVILLGVGWFKRKQNHRAIVVTGKVVSMRMEVERRYIRTFLLRRFFSRYYGHYATRFGDDTVSSWYGNPVTVYKPIVRFSSSDGEQEAVVQDSSEYKPELNMSMEIAFFPENPKIAWRPAKKALWGDCLLFLGAVLLLAGVLDCFGLIPFLADETPLPAEEDW